MTGRHDIHADDGRPWSARDYGVWSPGSGADKGLAACRWPAHDDTACPGWAQSDKTHLAGQPRTPGRIGSELNVQFVTAATLVAMTGPLAPPSLLPAEQAFYLAIQGRIGPAKALESTSSKPYGCASAELNQIDKVEIGSPMTKDRHLGIGQSENRTRNAVGVVGIGPTL